MSPEKQRIAIATACGWKRHADGLGYYQGVHPALMGGRAIPDYLNDLNACHEMEKVLTEKQMRTYAFTLAQVLNTSPTVDLDDQFLNIHATAAEKCEAFLRTLGLWEEVAQ